MKTALTGDKRGRRGTGRLDWTSVVLIAALGFGCATQKVAPPPNTRAQTEALSPAQALARLEAGNARFVAGKTFARDWPAQREHSAQGQYPFAVVLSCVDSRVGSEIIFDQGLGDIFSARVAGNVLSDEILGWEEFRT